MNRARNLRLLIVDDNEAIHADFKKVLSPRPSSSRDLDEADEAIFGIAPSKTRTPLPDFEIDSAHQGKEGFEMVQAALQRGTPYAMAFIDVRMPPGWDGVETTSKIWEIDPDIQVVICTAHSDYSWNEMLDHLDRSERLVILKKPFDSIEVLQLANSLTRKWQLLQDSKSKVADLEQLIVARAAQLLQEQEKFKTFFEKCPEGIFQIGADRRFLSANPALASLYGYSSPQELMQQTGDVQSHLYLDPVRLAEFHRRLEHEGVVREFQSEIKRRDGSRRWVSETACKVTKLDGSLLYYQGFVIDITAQKEAQKERDLVEANLRQAQKLESIGQLAAGIAHEINTPIQFIGDNLRFITDSFDGLNKLVAQCRQLTAAAHSNQISPNLLTTIESSCVEIDLEYLSAEIPRALDESLRGVAQVAHLVRAMKEFAHPGAQEKAAVDLNHAIETTIAISRNEWKYVAELTTEFDPKLPAVPCVGAEVNQVILNLIVNAAHAIAETAQKQEAAKGLIKISTRRDGPWAEIRVADTGPGIPENIQHRIFDPFFTTKGVGKGSGQGLAIARSTVVDKHGGQLTFESTLGQGAVFIVRLPIVPPAPCVQPKSRQPSLSAAAA